MHIYNKVHVLLSTLSYMFRRLLRHLQGELYRKLKTIATVYEALQITDLKMYFIWVYNVIYNYLKTIFGST
jgi:hypothetical protein